MRRSIFILHSSVLIIGIGLARVRVDVGLRELNPLPNFQTNIYLQPVSPQGIDYTVTPLVVPQVVFRNKDV